MIKVVTLQEDLYEKYSAYVASRPEARFGHDLEWAMVLRDTYGVSIQHLIALEDEKVVGICPFFLCKPIVGGMHYKTSLFPSYFGPLYDSTVVLGVILETIQKKARDLQYAEIVSPLALPADHAALLPHVENLDYTFRIPLTKGIDAVFDSFCRDYKRILRKPGGPDTLELLIDENGSLVNEFYRLYVSIYAGKHGSVPHVRKLFDNVFARYPKGRAKLYFAKLGDEYVGAVFTFCTHREVYYAWSAVKPDSVYHPTHFLIWKMIQDAAAQGLDWFNMGESPREHHGLNHFKQGWGTEVVDPCRYFIPGRLTSPTVRIYDSVSWAKTIITRLPAPVVSSFLSPLIRFVL